jgi:plasmid stabilization system protein ParE
MPQNAWSNKRERQYEHIKESAKKRGTSAKRAKQIAAATVNKERARKGEARTASRSSTRDISSGRRGGLRSGTNRPKGRTKEQLYNEAKERGIRGRSRMDKAQLERALNAKR